MSWTHQAWRFGRTGAGCVERRSGRCHSRHHDVKAGDSLPRLDLADGSRGLGFAARMFKKPYCAVMTMTGFVLLLASRISPTCCGVVRGGSGR